MAKRAKQSAAFDTADGRHIVVNSEDIYADDHPYVLARPALFEDALQGRVIGERSVEQATAAPGEKRDTKKQS